LIFLIQPFVDIVKIDYKEGKSKHGEDVKTMNTAIYTRKKRSDSTRLLCPLEQIRPPRRRDLRALGGNYRGPGTASVCFQLSPDAAIDRLGHTFHLGITGGNSFAMMY
jgi:hypothetical protein